MFSKFEASQGIAGRLCASRAFRLALFFTAIAPSFVLAQDTDLDGLTDVEEATAGTDPLLLDTDGDGLWDGWEVRKQVLSTPLNAADPKKKDLFIEIDRLAGSLTDAERANLESDLTAAFSSHGITLHLEWDVQIAVGPGQDPLTVSGWNALRTANFDMGSKRLSHRHAFYGLRLTNDSGHSLDGRALGIPDQFFVLASRKPDSTTFTRIDLAATFMHELGHTLGLGHGGINKNKDGKVKPDLSTMVKPNHLSVMNYSWSDSGLLYRTTPASFSAFIDYQSFELPALNEKSLTESIGLQFPSGSTPIAGLQTRARIAGEDKKNQGLNVAAVGAIDWNRNGVSTDVNVPESVNGDTDRDTLKMTLNEWDNLTFDGGLIGSAWFYSVFSR